MSSKYDTIVALTQTTLPKYISKTPLGWINEMVPKTMLAGKMLRRCKKTIEGGTTIQFDLQLEAIAPGRWVGPNEKLELKGIKSVQRGSVPWRFYQDAWFIDYKLVDLNKGTEQVIIDIMQSGKEQVSTATVQDMEDKINALDGNYNHDAAGSSFLLPLGYRYWFTPHGFHITNDSSKSVAGINPNTYTRWKNPYITPAAASDSGDVISHIRELPQAMERMSAEMYFESADVWGELAKDIDHGPKYDPDGKQSPEDLMIVCDRTTNLKYREVLFDYRDDVSRDQARGRPTWKGIPVDWDVSLGLNSNGYGKDAAGNALWTDGAAAAGYTVGNWPSTGEMFFFNTKYFHFICHSDHMPFVKKPYEPEGMMGLAFEYDVWLQTMCRSRRRGGGVIMGYSLVV